jgi:hypothetical protein
MLPLASDFRGLLALETVGDWLATIGLAGLTGSIAGAVINYVFEGRKFKREQRIAHLKESLDKFYSPLVFHFENMKSWGKVWGEPYVFATEVLGAKIGDMNEIMRTGLRFASAQVEALWYEWQPFAVAVVERRRGQDMYPHLTTDGFILRSQRLHEALRADHDELEKEYNQKMGLRADHRAPLR